MPHKDPVVRKAYMRHYLGLNRESHIANVKAWKALNRAQVNANTNRRRVEIRLEVLTHYGRGRLACLDCGFDDMRALSLDHVNGNGAAERRKLGTMGRSVHFYRRLKRLGYPEGYETVCMNHQFIRRCTLGISTRVRRSA